MSARAGADILMNFGIIPDFYMDKDFVHGNKLHRRKEFIWFLVASWNTQF